MPQISDLHFTGCQPTYTPRKAKYCFFFFLNKKRDVTIKAMVCIDGHAAMQIVNLVSIFITCASSYHGLTEGIFTSMK